jgi:hypothetical protein
MFCVRIQPAKVIPTKELRTPIKTTTIETMQIVSKNRLAKGRRSRDQGFIFAAQVDLILARLQTKMRHRI